MKIPHHWKDKIPLEYDKNGRPKIKKEKPNKYKRSFSVKRYKDGVLHFHSDKIYLMSELEVTNHVLGVVMIKQYILNAGLKSVGKYG